MVRVTAESLTRLMGLAGESLVQSRQLRPFVDALLAPQEPADGAADRRCRPCEDRRERAVGASTRRSSASCWRGPGRRPASARQALGDKIEEIEDFARRGEDLSGRLHHEVLASRMRPLADGVRGFPRLVRDVARELGKQVRFEVGRRDHRASTATSSTSSKPRSIT